MADDLYDPSLNPEPFDLSNMLPPQAAPSALQAQPASGSGKKKSTLANIALAALMPLAAKQGGQMAVSGLLRGMQRAQNEGDQRAQQDFQNQRLTAGDQRAVEQQQANEAYRQQTLQQHQRDQAAAVVKDFTSKLAAASSKEEIDGLSQAFRYAGQVVGIRPDAVEGLIAKTAPTTSAIIEKQVRKVVGGLTPEQVDQYLQGGMSIMVPGQQLPVPVDVWSKYVVTGLDPATGKRMVAVKKPQAERIPIPGSFEDFTTTTDPVRREKILGDRKLYGQSDDAQRASGGLFGPTTGAGADDDVKSVVDAIIRGDQPPTLQGFYGNTLKVRGELGRRGYDLTTANTDYQATQQYWKTLNGAQQTRMRQAVDNASHSLDVIDALAAEWKGGRFPLLNRGRLAAARNGALGPEAQRIATALEAQIADVTSELANVYMGGNSPTDHAMGLAAKNLQSNWSEPQLKALIEQQRRNLQIRSNSIKNAAAITPSSQGATPPPVADEWVRVNGKLVKRGAP